MTLLLCASMQFIREIKETAATLEAQGHTVHRPGGFELWEEHGREKGEDGELEFMREYDIMRKHYGKLKGVDAVLVLNYEKNGVAGYIGGGVLMEMGFAHVLQKPIYLLNPIPDVPYRDEIEVTNPVVLDGDLNKIPLQHTPPFGRPSQEGNPEFPPTEGPGGGSVRAGAMRRVQTFDSAGKENGFLMELLKDGRKTRAYLTCVTPGSFKGYHLHRVRATNYAAIRGTMKVVLYVREGGAWKRQEHILESTKGATLSISTHVATGFSSATNEEAWLINFPDPAYDPEVKDEQVEYSEEELEDGVMK